MSFRPLAVLLALLVLAAGCLSAVDAPVAGVPAPGTVTSVYERASLPFVLDDEFSRPLVAGVLDMLPVEEVFLPVDLPATEGAAAAEGGAIVHMGIFRPDVPPGTKVPVIADIGPYYGDGDVDALTPAERLGRFLIENYVPHGYAVAQVSVFGSGLSTHCMDLMGLSEQLGIDAAVTYLGSQEWSNGNVGLIGRSYDGSTPWEAAMFGNPALKTIVPISGLVGVQELMWRNGSAEFRGPIMHNVVYGQFGIDQDAGDAHTACPDYASGPAQGLGAYVTGDHFAPEVNEYWAERYFLDRALENYRGSVFLIHGLQDWNVDNHMAFPTHQRVQDAGLEIKGLYGQWAHMYPDRASEHETLPEGRGAEAYPESVRLDWAQDLLEWFDHYLKGTGPKPALQVEVQDNMGAWRVEETYPPRDATWVELGFDGAEWASDAPAPVVGGPSVLGAGAPQTIRLTFPALSETEDVRIAGMPQLPVVVTPSGPGGQLFAELRDADTGLRLGHAIMDLRFAAGGTEMQPVAPGMPLTAMMEFFAMDVVLPAGHALELRLAPTGEDYLPSAVSAPVTVDMSAASMLRLPTVVRAEDVFFTLPAPTKVAEKDDITS